jgi:hypothetical protein
MPLAGLSTKPVFQEWHDSVFVQYLSVFTGVPLDQLAPGDGRRFMTFLSGSDSKRFKAIDIRKHPYRGLP